jgi:excisionase family DNA binding protein
MDQPKPTLNAPDSTPAFTLTEAQLRKLIREEVQTALARDAHTRPLLTAEELAAQVKVPVSWVYEQSRQGNIPTVRIGRYIRFRLVEVIASQQSKN